MNARVLRYTYDKGSSLLNKTYLYASVNDYMQMQLFFTYTYFHLYLYHWYCMCIARILFYLK